MRSRYSAYALGLADYIVKTTHFKFRGKNKENIEKWMTETKWTHLEILDTVDGLDNDEIERSNL